MSERRHFLVIDDSVADGAPMQALPCRLWHGEVELTHCAGVTTALERLENGRFDGVVLACQPGDDSDLEALRAIRGAGADLPVVLMSGHAIAAVAVGAPPPTTEDALTAGDNPVIDQADLDRQIHEQELELQRKLAEIGTLLERDAVASQAPPKQRPAAREYREQGIVDEITRVLPTVRTRLQQVLTAAKEVIEAAPDRPLDTFQHDRISQVLNAGAEVSLMLQEVAAVAVAGPDRRISRAMIG